MYRYTDLDGSRKTIYTSNLNALREQEKLIQRDIDDGIGYKAGATTYKKIYRVTKSIEKSRNNKYLPKSSKNTQIVKIQ